MGHTQYDSFVRPWTYSLTNAGIALFDANGDTICWDWDISNDMARFIVQAVNSHDALVNALNRTLGIVTMGNPGDFIRDNQSFYHKVVKDAQTALNTKEYLP